MWIQCDEEDIDVLPVSYVRCISLQEENLLKKIMDYKRRVAISEKNSNERGFCYNYYNVLFMYKTR